MIKQIKGFFSNDLSIDLGTANTLIYVQGRGIVLDEPSVVAIANDGRRLSERTILAVGKKAKDMLGRTPGHITAVRPMKDGVIADFIIARRMLQYFIRAVSKGSFFSPSPRVVICVPSGATQVERHAIKESAEAAGARKVFLLEEPMAAAIGADMPVAEAQGSMVVDIGGGTAEIAVLSLNGVVISESLRIAGDNFDDSIVQYVRKKFGIVIGYATAEKIKHEIGCASPSKEIKEIVVRGRSVNEGIPKTFTLNSNEVLSALQESLNGLVDAIRRLMENTPPELSADIATHGIVLTGGGALLCGIERLFSQELGLPVRVATDPLTCVARGGGIYLDMTDNFKDYRNNFSE